MVQSVWPYVASVYPMTLFVSIPWSIFLLHYKWYISKNRFFYYLNHIFIEQYGYIMFSVAYFGFAAAYIHDRRKVLVHLQKYALITGGWIVFNEWFFGRLIFERVNVYTGGYCEVRGIADKTISMYRCTRSLDGIWIDGFDPSGHLYFLSTASLALWKEIIGLGLVRVDWENQTVSLDEESDSAESPESRLPLMKTVGRMSAMLSLFLIIVWYFEFDITCLFFHTIPEKISGLLVGIAVILAYSHLDNV